MPKKKKLSKKEKQTFDNIYLNYLNKGFSYNDTNFKLASSLIMELYKDFGQENNIQPIQVPSPFSANILMNYYNGYKQNIPVYTSVEEKYKEYQKTIASQFSQDFLENIKNHLGESLRFGFHKVFENDLGLSMNEVIDKSIERNLFHDIYASMTDALSIHLVQNFDDSLYHNVSNKMLGGYRAYSLGQVDSYWIAFYKFFEVLGIQYKAEDSKRLDILDQLAGCSYWWWPFENAVLICEKPVYLGLDENFSLHAIGRQAVEFSDGTGIYYVHGLDFPEKFAGLPIEEWTGRWLIEERNLELRQMMIRVLGYEQIMKDLGSVLIHKEIDRSGNIMELHRIKESVDIEPIRLLKVVCPSTAKIHILRVPPQISTCEKARRWTLFDVNGQYNIKIET